MRYSHTGRWLLASVGAGCIAAGSAAQAQTGAKAAEPDPAAGEIIVTAEKRSESLQKTPVAVTAISGEQIVAAGLTDLREAQRIVPGARFQNEGNTTQVFIRGVGSGLDYGNIEPTVGFTMNGLYVPREGTSAGFFDIASIEVLPGPQATLYGRSSLGGTVNVAFKRPEHDNSGSLLLEGGNYDMLHVTLAQNFAVSDELALRGAINYFRHDGYETTGADSADDVAWRLSALYDPSPDFSAYVWAMGATKHGAPHNPVNHGLDPVTGQYDPDAFLTKNPWNDDRSQPPLDQYVIPGVGAPRAGTQDYDYIATGAQFDVALGDDATLTYIPGYISLDSAFNEYWLGVVPAAISQYYRMQSHELRVSGSSDKFEWLAGLYLYDQKNHGAYTVLGTFLNVDIRHNRLKGLGVFGQLTYHVTDSVRLTAGGRYSDDKRRADGFSPQVLAAPEADPDPASAFTFRGNYSNVDWKAALEWDVAPRVMLYAAAQTAYAPGTYNSTQSTPTFDNAVRPAHLTAFTGGFKSRTADGRLQLNTEFYFSNYRNFIIQAYDINKLFNPLFNAQRIHVYGFQMDALWSPTDRDRINLNIGYTHARNKRFVTPDGDDFTGLAPQYAPDWTIAGGYSHIFPMPGGDLVASVSGRFESKWWADYVHNLGTLQTASAKGDASLTYESDKGWKLGAWVKNFTDKAVIAATGAAGLPGPATAFLEAPRTYGLRFSIDY